MSLVDVIPLSPVSSGVLVVKKRLVRNAVPEGAGGGTVFFVRRQNHRYLQVRHIDRHQPCSIFTSVWDALVVQSVALSIRVVFALCDLQVKATHVWHAKLSHLIIACNMNIVHCRLVTFMSSVTSSHNYHFVQTFLAQSTCALVRPVT